MCKEIIKQTQKIYDGRIIKVVNHLVECPNGNEAYREVVCHPGGVAVVPVDNEGFVYMVRQYRIPYDRMMLEVPAGKLDSGENPDVAAKRELREETGLIADKMVFMGHFYPSVGFCDEDLRMYLATGFTQGETDPDADEFVYVEKIHIDDIVNMIMNNEISDGKTIAAILKAYNILKQD